MHSQRISYENKKLICLAFILFIQILLDFCKVLLRGDSSLVTYFVYVASLLVFLFVFRKNISVDAVGKMLLLYFIFATSFLLFPETQRFYHSDSFRLVCLYFFPIVFIVIRTIEEWTNFFKIMSWFGTVAVLMGVYIVFFSGVDNYDANERYFTYMEFSYALLPFVCSLYVYAKDSRKWLYFFFFALGLFEMLAFGSRATVLFALAFILISGLLSILPKANKGLLFLTLPIAIIVISFNRIIRWLSSIPYLQDSYIMRHILSGEFFIHDTRRAIYENCLTRINTMGLDISGFFGDRQYCELSIYPHNIILEVLMQWGWFLGILMLVYILILLVNAFRRAPNKTIPVFFVVCLLGRYFLSGTYVTEGRFWIFYGCILALVSRKNHYDKSDNQVFCNNTF